MTRASENLERNLAALPVQLRERLSWPVEGDHFRLEAGRWSYVWRGASFDAAVEASTAAELVRSHGSAEGGLILGVGGGELVNAALAEHGDSRWVAWDRDPWVLRQALSANDWSAALTSGRLTLALNADILDHVERGLARLEHPLLGAVYDIERRLLADGVGTRRALVCTGELFVDSVIDALRGEGWSLFAFEPFKQSLEELDLIARRVEPELVVSINFVPGMAEFCEARGLDYLCWEIDPALDAPRVEGAASRTHLHTYRRSNVERYRRAGVARARYTPLAADSARRRPLELTPEQREHFGAPVAFVGASCVDQARVLAERFSELHESWRPGSGDQGRVLFDAVVSAQREDFTTYRVPQLLDARAPGFRAAVQEKGAPDPAHLVGELCAAEKRLNYVAELADFGIEAWGDAGWRVAETHGVRYRGPAKHETELPLVYNAARVNLDIGRLYQSDIVTMRVFDICACGGFVLAEHSDALEELFEVGVEVESYRDISELRAKVAHYLAHEGEAREIAARGREAVLERHRIDARVRGMLDALDQAPAT